MSEFTKAVKFALNPDDESEIGQIRSLTEEMQEQIVIENILPELKRSVPALLKAARAPDVRFTDQELRAFIREAIRQQRIATPFAGRLDPALDEAVFKRAKSMVSRDAAVQQPFDIDPPGDFGPTRAGPPGM